jgi:hypothetical protein
MLVKILHFMNTVVIQKNNEELCHFFFLVTLFSSSPDVSVYKMLMQ